MRGAKARALKRSPEGGARFPGHEARAPGLRKVPPCALLVTACLLLQQFSKDMFNRSRLLGASSLVTAHAYYDHVIWEKILQ